MKKLFTLIVLVLILSSNIFAQPPQSFKYQVVVRNNAGETLQNQAVGVRISIHEATATGTIIYQETFSETTNGFGLVNLQIGNGTPIIGVFSGIDWGSNPKFLETEIDPTGGSAYVSMGTSELLSVPYSLFSDRSSLVSNEGTGNILLGKEVAKTNTSGHSNAYVGFQSGFNNSTGYVNSFLGYRSGYSNSSGAGNTFIGNTSGYSNTLGGLNTFIGDRCGYKNTEGGHNTFAGYKSGYSNTIGNENIFLGYKAGYYETGSNKLYIHNSSSSSPLIYGEFDNSILAINGKVGIGTSNPAEDLHVKGHIRVGEDFTYPSIYGELIHDGAGTGFKINAAGGGWADLHFQTQGTTKMFIESAGNVGIGTTNPQSKLDVRGNITIRSESTGNIVMELGTGLDYAEGFNVSDSIGISAGTILCIDPENSGKLVISKVANDKKVAGIVAGANGLGSGIRLGADQFDFDVALAGRVYCNVDATAAGIEAGDLLTTSSTPGFAMKVTDFKKARGAILGKAMESLEKGKKGQILVLVTLQ